MRPVEQERPKRNWRFYLISSLSFLLTVLLVVAVVYFWEEMQNVESLSHRYGYLGGFLVSILGGITVIPIPSLLIVFTLGGVLNPVYLGLISGLGEALGGISVYSTGAGGGAIWSKLRSRWQTFNPQPSLSPNSPASAQSKPRSRWQTLYYRLAGWAERRGTFWFVFITSAFVWGLYYPASLAAGTLRMGLLRFFLISWAGKTVKGMTVAFAGYWGLRFLLQWIGI